MIFIGHTINTEPAIELAEWEQVYAECAKHRRFSVEVESYTEERQISLQQIRWWKGVLLPALSKDNGDSVSQWETTLKLNVMPEEFEIETVKVHGIAVNYIPSITKLNIKKTNILVEGSVAWLHDAEIHGDRYTWVTLPDRELRRT